MRIPAICLAWLASLAISNAQNIFQESLQEYVLNQKQEKVYLHLDKPDYGIGDQIWFKAYITNSTFHTPTTVSGTLYVELIDPNLSVIDSLTLPIEEGTTSGNFALSWKLKKGVYRIRAYTTWMKNFDSDFFFTRDFNIIDNIPSDDEPPTPEQDFGQNLLVDFFPEGGDLINSIATKIAIKATDNRGKGVSVDGLIQDNNGVEITKFTSNELGHAICFLRPELGTSYHAIIDGSSYPLPSVYDRGIAIKVIHSHTSTKLDVFITSKGIDLSGGKLIGHQRGQLLFDINCTKKDVFFVRLDKTQLNPGIIQLTFFTKDNVPLSERLVFPIIPPIDSVLQIQPDKNLYAKRSSVSLGLTVVEDSILSSSLTINPKEEVNYENHENIVNYLLLSSDLKGRIESPNHYFSGTPGAYQDLDLLMLTQGWSRFKWDTLLNNAFQPTFQPEYGLTIRGMVVDYFQEEKQRKADLFFTVPKKGILGIKGETDENGQFFIEGNQFYDTTLMIIQATGFKGRKSKEDENVSIRIVPIAKPKVSDSLFSYKGWTLEFEKKINKQVQISRAFNFSPDATLLDEVVVTAQSYEDEERYERTSLYAEPTNRIDLDDLGPLVSFATINEILLRVPGVLVSGNSITIQGVTSLTGSNTPLFVLDGIFVEQTTIQQVPVPDIDFIDVLKGADASIYGSQGANGVILVYTKTGESIYTVEESKGLLIFNHPGYDKAKEFYSPKYDVPREEHVVPDYRSTLFWEPNLTFENGKALVEFYTSDQSGAYTIRVEGLRKNGSPFFIEDEMFVK